MKLSYYGYSFTEFSKSKKPSAIDLIKICKNFFNYFSPAIKNSLKNNGENQYLIDQGGNLFLFIQTRSQELIKKINSKNISVSEIYESLEDDENIGFASYVYIDNLYLSFGSTLMAPRINSFVDFINSILDLHQISNYRFSITPFLSQTTPSEIKKAHHIGKTTLRISKDNSLSNEIKEFFGGEASYYEDIDSFEIIIRPKLKKDISKAVTQILDKTSEENGIEKFIIAAKLEEDERLTDYYLSGRGIVSDYIDVKKENNIEATIKSKVDKNNELLESIKRYELTLSKVQIAAITDLHRESTWVDLNLRLSAAD